MLASPTTAAKIIRAVNAQVRAASARELASDHLCLGMISPVAPLRGTQPPSAACAWPHRSPSDKGSFGCSFGGTRHSRHSAPGLRGGRLLTLRRRRSACERGPQLIRSPALRAARGWLWMIPNRLLLGATPRFPFARIKIDRTCGADLGVLRGSLAIIRALIAGMAGQSRC